TIAGGGNAYPGSGGQATAAQLKYPWGLVYDGTSNSLFVSERDGGIVSGINLSSGVITTVAGTGTTGPWDDSTPLPGDGLPATSVQLAGPEGLATSSTGGIGGGATTLLIADTHDNRVRIVNMSTGIITAYAGTGAPATPAQVSQSGNPTSLPLT